MGSSTIRLDRSLFSDEVVARKAHRYTGQFHVALRAEGADIVVVLTPLEGSALPADVAGRFQNDALDENLRALVRTETHEIHSQLITAALREATPGPNKPHGTSPAFVAPAGAVPTYAVAHLLGG